jgi:adenylate cyclase
LLTEACADCGTPLGKDERFCTQCGTPVASVAPPSPATVPAAAERKHITVLFADVAGSMDLQERLDAEVWAQIMGRFVSILAEGVRKFGGTVDKFTGDGIMALFGAPVAQEDHARRACHAAWYLTRAIGEYSQELRSSQGVELHVRLGLNSGEVVVGRVGEDVTLDPTALGHTVGLAQRMEAMAESGKAFLTAHTARLVEGWFSLEDLGPISVKGVREPLIVYALGGPSPSPPVLHGAGLGVAPLVGRERELAVLEDALAVAMEGHAQVVGVVGEAGVGKSRLCEEFAASVANRGITVRRTAGVSHGKDVPLLPILAYLRDYFGITETHSPEQARATIAARLLDLDPGLDGSLPLVFDFLEVADPDRPAPRLGPEVRMQRVFEIIRRVAERRSEREVLLLVFEDLHWFDPQSEVFLERLIESFPGSRTMVVVNFRPEFQVAWMGRPYYRQLPLVSLGDTAVSHLLGGLLGADLSLSPLLGFVVERTAGNPFFVEELVRSLVEDGTLAGGPGSYRLTRPLHEVKVPPSVQAVLAARIDRLPPENKAVLQAAAVIGRQFPALLLAEVAGTPSFETSLSVLCGVELLQQAGDGEYRFWHPLTQEVAYGALVRDRRRSLHATVARALIAADPNRLDERAALIASHFHQADNLLEAARWNDRAAGWALRSDMSEAMRRWAVVVDLSEGDDSEEAIRLAVRARNRLVRFGARTGTPLDEAGRFYREGRELAERVGDAKLVAGMAFAFGTANVFRGAIREGFDVYLEAVRLAAQTGDAALEAACLSAPARLLHWLGPLSEGFRLVDRMVKQCGGDEELGVETLGYGVLGYQCLIRSELLALMGEPAQARRWADDGVEIHRRRSEPEFVAWTLTAYADIAHDHTQAQDALAGAHEAMRITEELGNIAVHVAAARALGVAQIALERFEEAVNTLAAALAEARGRGVGLFEESTLLAHLASAHLGASNVEGALQVADEAVEVARRQGAKVVECFARLIRARVLRTSQRHLQRAHDDLDRALALVAETGAVAYGPFLHEELGRLHNDDQRLREALRLYRQIGATGHASRLEGELSSRSAP